MHRLTESNIWYDVIRAKWRTLRHFTQKSATTWWVKAKHTAWRLCNSTDSSWSIVHSYFLWCNQHQSWLINKTLHINITAETKAHDIRTKNWQNKSTPEIWLRFLVLLLFQNASGRKFMTPKYTSVIKLQQNYLWWIYSSLPGSVKVAAKQFSKQWKVSVHDREYKRIQYN